MTEKKSYRKQFIAILLFFVAYCLFLSWSFLFQNVDDAYISFRYGWNMMHGNGLVYNAGEYVEGYTNFLWTVITAPFTSLSFADVSAFAIILCLLISLYNIIYLSKISSLFDGEFEKFRSLLTLVPPLFLAVDNSIAFWAIGGMESPMYTLFILGIVYSYLNINKSRKYFYLLIVNLMLCTLTRPEGNMIFGILLIHAFVFRKNIVNFRKFFTGLIAYYAVFFIIYYGLKFLFYGQFIPNTFYAKGVTDFKMNLILGSKYLALCTGTRLYIFIFIAFIPFKKIIKKFSESFLLLLSAVYLVYILAVGGDWMIANRFFVPVLPLIYLLSIIGMINFFIKLQSVFRSADQLKKYGNRLVASLTVLLFVITISFLEYKQLIIKDDNANYEMHWSMFGKWLKMNVPPNTVIAVGPAGKIPYYSQLYTIDMWGLNNDYIARTKSKRLQAGHKKFDFQYVLSLNPEFIIGGYEGFTDKDIPSRYEKFNAPEDEYKCYDIVYRLKEEYRNPDAR